MKSVGIIKHNCDAGPKGKILHKYDGAPNPSGFSRSSDTVHAQVPQNLESEKYLKGSFDEHDVVSVVVDTDAKTASQSADQLAYTQNAVLKAKSACATLEIDFMVGNSMLGIKDDGLEVKQEVASKMESVLATVRIGDPDMVFAAIKAIPEGDYDSKYVTEARLLAAANKLKTALGKPTVTSLDDL